MVRIHQSENFTCFGPQTLISGVSCIERWLSKLPLDYKLCIIWEPVKMNTPSLASDLQKLETGTRATIQECILSSSYTV